MPSPKEEKIPLLNIEDCDADVLEYNGYLTQLYKDLGFKQLNFETAYRELICEQFEGMSDDTRYEHLNALAAYWQKMSSAGRTPKDFLDFLKGQPMIRPCGDNQNLVHPEEAYSPGRNLFKMFKRDQLIPDRFLTNRPLMIFLEEVGVKTWVGRSDVLEFARQIERGDNLEDNVLQELLHEAFNDCNTSEPGRKGYLKELGGIKFVPRVTTQLQSILDPTVGMYAFEISRRHLTR